jgi:hypothetical protein
MVPVQAATESRYFVGDSKGYHHDIVRRFGTGVDDHDMSGYFKLVQNSAALLDKLFS